jgi:hypothetical protein
MAEFRLRCGDPAKYNGESSEQNLWSLEGHPCSDWCRHYCDRVPNAFLLSCASVLSDLTRRPRPTTTTWILSAFRNMNIGSGLSREIR